MAFKDRVYGAVSGRTGMTPKNAKMAADATIDLLKTKMPPVLGRALDAMMESEGGNILWEFAAPGADGDRVNLASSAVESTAVKAAEAERPAPSRMMDAQAMGGPAKKSLWQRFVDFWPR